MHTYAYNSFKMIDHTLPLSLNCAVIGLFNTGVYQTSASRTSYSATNSTGATQSFSANDKTSLEQKNWSSFISDQSQ